VEKTAAKKQKPLAATAEGQCLCGKVRFEIGVPARWAWHDHSKASRQAHGAAYATYVGCWKSRVRITKGAIHIARFEHEQTRTARNFCAHCGTPLFYERAHSPLMINIPRALFETRTGREPLYHIAIEQSRAARPAKGFPRRRVGTPAPEEAHRHGRTILNRAAARFTSPNAS
jgi:hypothetical protein